MPNRFQTKRTSTSGRTPNTTNSGNTQYIAAGEFGLNMADQILYTSDGTNLIEIGANNTNSRVSGNISLTTNDKRLTFAPLAGGANVYFVQQNDDNFVFYSTNGSNQPRAIWSVFANSTTSNLIFSAPAQFNSNVNLGAAAGVYANGSFGSAGQVLSSNGTATYWTTPSAASVNTAFQWAWTNTQSFSANVAFTGNNISLVSNTGSILLAGSTDTNWRIGRNTGTITKFFYSNNTLDIVAAGSSLEGVAIGQPGANSYLETGYAGTFTRLPVYVGNSTVNVTINSTSFTGTANNSLYLGGTLAASYVQNTDSRTLSGNLNFSGANTTINAEFRVVNSTANVFFAAANGNVGIGTTTPAAPLHIPTATYPVALMERTTTLTTGMRSTFVAQHTTTADMTDGFGADVSFRIRDSAGVDNEIANVGARRDGADNSGRIAFISYNAGVGTENMTIKSSGNVGISNTTPAHKLRVDGTTSLAGAVSDITTLAAGNTTVTGFVNATSSVNTATFTVGTAFTANSTLVNAAAINITGQINTTTLYATTSANIASAVQANATGVYTTGTMNAASLTVGSNFIANTTKLTLASGSVFEIPSTSVITSFVADPIDTTNKVFAYRVYPTISYDPVSLTNGDSISGAVFSSSLKASSNLTTGTIFGYGNFTALSTDATSSGGYQNHDLRGIYGNMYHFHNSNLLRMVGTAGRTYNRGTGTVSAAYSLWARSSTSTGGGAITDSHGMFVDDIAAGVNNFGITSTVSSGTNKWNFYANGSAQNYFAGNVGIGNTTPAFKLRVDGTTSLAGAVSDITTLAAGNTTVTGFINTTSSVNTATFTVGTAFTANSTLVNAAAINITGQVNTATFFATTSANVGSLVQTNTTAFLVSTNSTVNTIITATSITQANTTAVPFVANVTGVYHTGVVNAASHTTTGFTANTTAVLVYSNSTVNTIITPTSFTQANTTATPFVANVTGLYHTGTANAASHTVGALFTANSTLVNAAAINITGQVNTATFFASTSANVGANVQANTTAFLVSTNSTVNTIITATSLTQANTTATPLVANVTGLYHTGTVNAASHTVGTSFIANTTGAYHTGVINAASYTTTGIIANTSGVYPASNTTGSALGNTISRWIINANTINGTGDWTTTANVGIGIAASATYRLQVNGAFAATTKSFVIDHPTKPDMKLRYGSLEGPENGVYVRGRSNTDTIVLPDYWTGLVDESSVTVNITPIGKKQSLYVKDANSIIVTIGGGKNMEYYFTVFAERKDVEKLEVEF